MAIELAFGFDHGHGESCVCFVVVRDINGQPIQKISEPKKLCIKGLAQKVYSNVLYDSNGNAIGFGIPDDAENAEKIEIPDGAEGNIAAYFKKSPIKWDDKIIAGNVSKSSKEVMGDFIAKVMAAVRANEHNLELPKGPNYDWAEKCAIYVGCPSDILWTCDDSIKKYEDLIRTATGIDEVHVVPESTAAILSMISKMPANALQNGICVFDFGSSTADFTYIKLIASGKILIETSWTLGASAIEDNIISKALKLKGVQNPYRGNYARQQLEVRKNIKEAWFGDADHNGNCTLPDGIDQTIKYETTDANGGIVSNQITVRIDQAFMDDVIDKMPVRNVSESGTPIRDNSWSGHCKEFFKKCHRLIINKNLDCSTIVLTGGASRMPFIKELCEDEFIKDPATGCPRKNAPTIIMEASPSYSVSNGLCQVAINDVRLETIKSELANDLTQKKKTILNQYSEDLLESFSDYTYTLIKNYTVDLINRGVKKVRADEFQSAVNVELIENFTVQKSNELLDEPMKKLNNNCRDCIEHLSEECAKELYPNQNSSSLKIDKDILAGYDLSTSIDRNINVDIGYIYSSIAFWSWLLSNKIKLSKIADPDKKDMIKEQLKKDYKNQNQLVPSILNQQFGKDNIKFNDKMSEMFDYALDAVALKHN